MRKVVIDKELKAFFEEELDRIIQNNHKEKSQLEWEYMNLQREFEKVNTQLKKLKKEKKQLEELIIEYDKNVNKKTKE